MQDVRPFREPLNFSISCLLLLSDEPSERIDDKSSVDLSKPKYSLSHKRYSTPVRWIVACDSRVYAFDIRWQDRRDGSPVLMKDGLTEFAQLVLSGPQGCCESVWNANEAIVSIAALAHQCLCLLTQDGYFIVVRYQKNLLTGEDRGQENSWCVLHRSCYRLWVPPLQFSDEVGLVLQPALRPQLEAVDHGEVKLKLMSHLSHTIKLRPRSDLCDAPLNGAVSSPPSPPAINGRIYASDKFYEKCRVPWQSPLDMEAEDYYWKPKVTGRRPAFVWSDSLTRPPIPVELALQVRFSDSDTGMLAMPLRLRVSAESDDKSDDGAGIGTNSPSVHSERNIAIPLPDIIARHLPLSVSNVGPRLRFCHPTFIPLEASSTSPSSVTSLFATTGAAREPWQYCPTLHVRCRCCRGKSDSRSESQVGGSCSFCLPLSSVLCIPHNTYRLLASSESKQEDTWRAAQEKWMSKAVLWLLMKDGQLMRLDNCWPINGSVASCTVVTLKGLNGRRGLPPSFVATHFYGLDVMLRPMDRRSKALAPMMLSGAVYSQLSRVTKELAVLVGACGSAYIIDLSAAAVVGPLWWQDQDPRSHLAPQMCVGPVTHISPGSPHNVWVSYANGMVEHLEATSPSLFSPPGLELIPWKEPCATGFRLLKVVVTKLKSEGGRLRTNIAVLFTVNYPHATEVHEVAFGSGKERKFHVKLLEKFPFDSTVNSLAMEATGSEEAGGKSSSYLVVQCTAKGIGCGIYRAVEKPSSRPTQHTLRSYEDFAPASDQTSVDSSCAVEPIAAQILFISIGVCQWALTVVLSATSMNELILLSMGWATRGSAAPTTCQRDTLNDLQLEPEVSGGRSRRVVDDDRIMDFSAAVSSAKSTDGTPQQLFVVCVWWSGKVTATAYGISNLLTTLKTSDKWSLALHWLSGQDLDLPDVGGKVTAIQLGDTTDSSQLLWFLYTSTGKIICVEATRTIVEIPGNSKAVHASIGWHASILVQPMGAAVPVKGSLVVGCSKVENKSLLEGVLVTEEGGLHIWTSSREQTRRTAREMGQQQSPSCFRLKSVLRSNVAVHQVCGAWMYLGAHKCMLVGTREGLRIAFLVLPAWKPASGLKCTMTTEATRRQSFNVVQTLLYPLVSSLSVLKNCCLQSSHVILQSTTAFPSADRLLCVIASRDHCSGSILMTTDLHGSRVCGLLELSCEKVVKVLRPGRHPQWKQKYREGGDMNDGAVQSGGNSSNSSCHGLALVATSTSNAEGGGCSHLHHLSIEPLAILGSYENPPGAVEGNPDDGIHSIDVAPWPHFPEIWIVAVVCRATFSLFEWRDARFTKLDSVTTTCPREALTVSLIFPYVFISMDTCVYYLFLEHRIPPAAPGGAANSSPSVLPDAPLQSLYISRCGYQPSHFNGAEIIASCAVSDGVVASMDSSGNVMTYKVRGEPAVRPHYADGSPAGILDDRYPVVGSPNTCYASILNGFSLPIQPTGLFAFPCSTDWNWSPMSEEPGKFRLRWCDREVMLSMDSEANSVRPNTLFITSSSGSIYMVRHIPSALTLLVTHVLGSVGESSPISQVGANLAQPFAIRQRVARAAVMATRVQNKRSIAPLMEYRPAFHAGSLSPLMAFFFEPTAYKTALSKLSEVLSRETMNELTLDDLCILASSWW